MDVAPWIGRKPSDVVGLIRFLPIAVLRGLAAFGFGQPSYSKATLHYFVIVFQFHYTFGCSKYLMCSVDKLILTPDLLF